MLPHGAVRRDRVHLAPRKAPEFNPFTRAVQADLLARQGQKRQSDAIRQDLSTGTIHSLSTAYVDFYRALCYPDEPRLRNSIWRTKTVDVCLRHDLDPCAVAAPWCLTSTT